MVNFAEHGGLRDDLAIIQMGNADLQELRPGKFMVTLPLLRVGDKGESVISAKALLYTKGFRWTRGRKAWGKLFDKSMEACVRRYQLHQGLEPTGEVDGETWHNLLCCK